MNTWLVALNTQDAYVAQPPGSQYKQMIISSLSCLFPACKPAWEVSMGQTRMKTKRA